MSALVKIYSAHPSRVWAAGFGTVGIVWLGVCLACGFNQAANVSGLFFCSALLELA